MGALGYLLFEEGEELLRRQRDDAVVALHGVRLPTCFSPWEGTFPSLVSRPLALAKLENSLTSGNSLESPKYRQF